MKVNDITGQRFGRLVAIRKVDGDPKLKKKTAQWLCKCDCGNYCVKNGYSLRRLWTRSCGCLQVESAKESQKKFFKHGDTRSRLHRIWSDMRMRCSTNAFGKSRKNYYERGIRVCAEWNDYDTFKKWAIENGYAENLTIDRIDNEKGYCPENCRWATPKQQARNTRVCVYYNGKTLGEWAEISGIHKNTLRYRLKHGMSIENALGNSELEIGEN